MPEPTPAQPTRADVPDELIYIAEVIFFEDNPVDGRHRIAVCTTLEAALAALREDDSDSGRDLVATETTSALGSRTARTWAVHQRGEEPNDEGFQWITAEKLTRSYR